MGGHENIKVKSKLKITEQIEIAGRNAAAVTGGAVSGTLAYLSGEAAFKTMNLVAQANEAGLISESGGFSVVEGIKAVGLGWAAFRTGAWSWRMHSMARAIESGHRPTAKKP
ncbi:hypothetical protein K2P56_00680 [Patescibacteria group bacterium]|nr:hypothetical protein [Patescibacteria group bacterium]